MILESLAQEIQTAGMGVVEQTIFVNSMPIGIDGIMLKTSLNGIPIDMELPGYRKTRIQIVVRDKSYQNGMSRANALNALLTYDNKSITGNSIKVMRPLNEPIAYPLTPGNTYEFSVNFWLVYAIV